MGVTEKEVREHFKNASQIRCAVSCDEGIIDGSKLFIDNTYVRQNSKDDDENWLILWNDTVGYAEILTYKPEFLEGTNMNINLSSTKPSPVESYKDIKTPKIVENQKPKQYQIGIDTLDRAEANMTYEGRMASATFLIDKYNWRKKDETESDLIKIIDYANWALKQFREEQKNK